MDALSRADDALARARGRAHVVTSEDVTSPMDAAATVQIPRITVDGDDPRHPDAETTAVIPPVRTWPGPPR